MGYKQLSTDERVVIAKGRAAGLSIRAIARELGRPPSTISREVRRNKSASGYATKEASRRCKERKYRLPKKLVARPELWAIVAKRLSLGHSPEQISGALKLAHPTDEQRKVSHEAIYSHIYAMPRGAYRTSLIQMLRKSRKTRKSRARGKDRRGKFTYVNKISERTEEANARAALGHWEGDLIKGAYGKSSVCTLVDRMTRYLILVKVNSATSADTLEGILREMRRTPAIARRTLTYDRGTEMALHKQIERRLSMKVFFADPYSPWQRGTSENTNGLVRQYLPKGTDLSVYSQKDLNRIASLLNNRPRKVLGYCTPQQAFDRALKDLSSVA